MIDRQFVESKLSRYTDEENLRIRMDLANIHALSFQRATPSAAPIYLATAGAPFSAKTTTLEMYLQKSEYKQFVYADPDQMGLKNMIHTYIPDTRFYHVAMAKSFSAAMEAAYEKWRDGSNFVSASILNAAYMPDDERGGQRYCIAHGTTSTSPNMREIYEALKKAGYRIVLLLCYAENDVREWMRFVRQKQLGFSQTTADDTISKSKLFPERFDLYFEFADEIHFFWNNDIKHQREPEACAHYQRSTDGKINLTIIEHNHWRMFCQKYSRDVKAFNLEASKAMVSLITRQVRKPSDASFFAAPQTLEAETPTVSSAPRL